MARSNFLRLLEISSAPLKKPDDFHRQQVIEKSKPSTVDFGPASTVDFGSTSTVDVGSASTVDVGSSSVVLWQAENGTVFPVTRVHHVDRAQDALTHIEESVYDFLWGTKTAEPYKLTEAGYAEIAKAARIAKRNAQVLIERLIEKGYISIERQADVWTRRPTQYRVLGYRAVLDELDRRGRRWVVKSGNGVLFVKRMEMRPTVDAGSTSTVDVGQPSTVDAGSTSTVDAASTVTRDHLKETIEGDTSSSVTIVVGERLRRHTTIDDDAVRQIVTSCQKAAPDATGEEIAHFAGVVIAKHQRNDGVKNLTGLMIRGAVAKYFQAPASELSAFRAEKESEKERSRQLASEILNEPRSSEQERQWAREVLQQ